MNGRAVAVMSITAALVVAGCTGSETDPPPVVAVSSGELRLASFDSCDQALTDLRGAILPQVGPYGLAPGGTRLSGPDADSAQPPMAEAGAAESRQRPGQDARTSDPSHSGTNTHEAGVDEPDLVKTDGRRIVTVVDGWLRVVDAESVTLTASLQLPGLGGADDLFLSGNQALVIRRGGYGITDGVAPRIPARGITPSGDLTAELLLVDLTGTPQVRGSFAIDGRFVDARMVGQTVRVVTHSQPRLGFGYPTSNLDEPASERRNREIVAQSTVDDWLPHYELRQGGAVQTGRVDCAAVSRPASYSANSMLTVLSFDLGQATLGTGDPVTVVADGDIVYGTAGSLYVASDTHRAWILRGGLAEPQGSVAPPQERTELYKFDTTGPGRPRHVASGAVPGSLLNQYSLSEFDGHLRVATTLGGPAGVSSVYVLAQRGATLEKVGEVGGLGQGERIYAVRFIGPLGYVVTFRQTDPLYTIDLRRPTAPVVTGELKITGFSAYLHPVDDDRLIGIGQEANDKGRALGTQVSLFDVADPANPSRVSQYHVPGASSEVEYDPHALLYWAKTGTLVLPLMSHAGRGPSDTTVVVLRVESGALTEVGRLTQPDADQFLEPIRRALVIDDTLWTISRSGASAHDLETLADRGWVAFGS